MRKVWFQWSKTSMFIEKGEPMRCKNWNVEVLECNEIILNRYGSMDSRGEFGAALDYLAMSMVVDCILPQSQDSIWCRFETG